MAKNKKKDKKKKNEGELILPDSKLQEKNISPSKENDNKSLNKFIPVFYGVLVGLIFFLIWGVYDTLNNGTFSLIYIMASLIGGFIIAAISRMLQNSGYFNFYRFLSVFLLLLPALMISTTSVTDGFTLSMFYILSIIGLLTALIPFIFKEMPVEKILTISISSLFVVIFALLMWGNKNIVPHEKTISWNSIYPAGAVFDKAKKHIWIIGDTQLKELQKGNLKDSVTFRIIKEKDPHLALVDKALAIKENLEQMSKKKKKKKNLKDSKPSNVVLQLEGKSFSWSYNANGEMVAVTQLQKSAKNNNNNRVSSLILFNLKNNTKKHLIKLLPKNFYFPWKSRTYLGYTTWSSDGEKFFFFSRDEKEGNKIYIGKKEASYYKEIPLKNAFSAFWTNDNDLIIFSGTRNLSKEKNLKEFLSLGGGMFDFIPSKTKIFRWNENMEKPEFLMDIKNDVKFVKVHPKSAKIFLFNGKEVKIFHNGLKSNYKKAFTQIPSNISSGLSEDGNLLVYQNVENPKNKLVLLVDLRYGGKLETKEIEKTKDDIKHVTLSRDNNTVLYTSCSSKRGFLQFRALTKVYKVKEGKLFKILPAFSSAGFRALDSYPGRLPFAYINNPYSGKAFMEQIVSKEGFGLIKEGVFLKMIFPPTIDPNTITNEKAEKKT